MPEQCVICGGRVMAHADAAVNHKFTSERRQSEWAETRAEVERMLNVYLTLYPEHGVVQRAALISAYLRGFKRAAEVAHGNEDRA